jgi:hypothetical protein
MMSGHIVTRHGDFKEHLLMCTSEVELGVYRRQTTVQISVKTADGRVYELARGFPY